MHLVIEYVLILHIPHTLPQLNHWWQIIVITVILSFTNTIKCKVNVL